MPRHGRRFPRVFAFAGRAEFCADDRRLGKLRRWACNAFGLRNPLLRFSGGRLRRRLECSVFPPLCAEIFWAGKEARLCRFSFARRFFLGGGGGIFFLPAICARGIREKVSAVWRAAMRLLSLRGAWIRPAGTHAARHTAALKRPLRGVFAHFYYMPGLEGSRSLVLPIFSRSRRRWAPRR